MWKPKENSIYGGWYIIDDAYNALLAVDENTRCIPVLYPANWPNEGTAQTLCDVLNMRDYGRLDEEQAK